MIIILYNKYSLLKEKGKGLYLRFDQVVGKEILRMCISFDSEILLLDDYP